MLSSRSADSGSDRPGLARPSPLVFSERVEEGSTVPLRPALRSTASPQTVLRGTVNPSSRQPCGVGPDGPLQGVLGAWAEGSCPPSVQKLRQLEWRRATAPYVCLHFNPTYRPSTVSYGEADQNAYPPSCQCPPSPGGRCSAPKNRLRERDRWSSGGQSAAEGGGAKRWPEEGRRSLSPSGRKKRSRHSRPGT